MPIPIQNARLTSSLVQKFGIKGRFITQLDEVVVPVVIAEDIAPERERLALGPYQEAGAEGAVVGEVGIMQFTGAPNFLMRPERIWVQIATAGRVNIRTDDAAVVPVFTGPASTRGERLADFSQNGPVPVTTGTIPLAGIGGNEVADYAIPAAESYEIDLRGWELSASQRLYVFSVTANDTFRWTAQWSAVRVPD